MKIAFNYDIGNFRVRESAKIKSVIRKIIGDNRLKTGNIIYVFTSDEKILEINREFLKHNYFTDIITFNYSSDKTVSGEIYISVPTVKENAGRFEKTVRDEMCRVIFHGVLHLCGYDDQNDDERKEMRAMEEKYLVFLSL